jgi:hypothetical protein
MPFGVTGGPGTFQSAMNSTLHTFLRKYILVFLDDILIYLAHLGRITFFTLRPFFSCWLEMVGRSNPVTVLLPGGV